MNDDGRAAVLRQGALRSFGRLPKPLRRLVTRAASPNWMAGAVALIEWDGRWLMVDPVYREGWTLPGGLIDRGETPAEAIKRELVEELGVDVDVDGVEPWILMDSAMRRMDVVFTPPLLRTLTRHRSRSALRNLVRSAGSHPTISRRPIERQAT